MRIEVDDEELFPPASSLVGLHFTDNSGFQACQAILWENLDRFRLVNEYARYTLVRKADVHLFAEAGLDFTRQEFQGSDELSPEDAYALDRAMIDEWMPRFVERLRPPTTCRSSN
jgi:hypothetical protein